MRLLQVHPQQVGAHIDQKLHALRQRVELGQQLHARCHQHGAQRCLRGQPRGAVRRVPTGRQRRIQRRILNGELLGQHGEETFPPLPVQLKIELPDARRPRPRRDFAAARLDTFGDTGTQLLHRAVIQRLRRLFLAAGDIPPGGFQVQQRTVKQAGRRRNIRLGRITGRDCLRGRTGSRQDGTSRRNL